MCIVQYLNLHPFSEHFYLTADYLTQLTPQDVEFLEIPDSV